MSNEHHDQPEMTLVPTGEGPNIETMQRADAPGIFKEFSDEAGPLLEQASALVVTADNHLVMARVAAQYRKDLKKIRCAAEARRKELVEGMKKKAKEIDVLAGVIWDKCETAEKKLLEIEEFAERQEQKRLDDLSTERAARVRMAEGNPSNYALREMPPEDFERLIDDLAAGQVARKAAAIKSKQEQEERERKEAAEREAQRLENERLKAEAIAREAAAKAEREKAEAERKAIEAKASAEREAAEDAARKMKEESDRKLREQAEAAEKQRKADEAKARAERDAIEAKAREERRIAEDAARKEREAREKLEAEIRAKELAEQKAIAERMAAEKTAALAPDRDKLFAFAKTVRTLAVPSLNTSEAGELSTEIAAQVEKFAAWIEKKAKAL